MNLESQLPLVLDLALKSSAILLAAFAIAWIARKTSAARRHLIWLAAFITLALLPLTLAIPPRWSWSLQRPAPAKSVILNTIPIAMDNLADSSANAAPAKPTWHFPGWPAIAVGIWFAVAFLLLARQAAGFWKLRGLRQDSSPITSAPAAEIAAEFGDAEIRESPLCAVPLTWGWSHPVILLPESAASWPETQLRAALAHEFGHIVRRDFLWRQLAQIVRALFWPNPLIWPALRALHRAQEEACDDLALGHSTSPREYAMQLLEAARSLSRPTFTATQAVAMALPSTLEGRIRAIVDEHRDRRAPGKFTRFSTAGVIATVVAGSAFAQVKSPPEAPVGQQVLLDVKFIEVPSDSINPADFAGNLVSKNTEALLKKIETKKGGMDLLSAPRIITRSGQAAMIESGEAPGPLAASLKFEATPWVIGNGAEIEIDFAATQVTVDKEHPIDGQPVVKTRAIKSNVSLASGQTCVFLSREQEKGRSLLITITASIVDPTVLPQPPKAPEPAKLPSGKPVPGKQGFLTSPYAPDTGYIDVRGFAPGTEIKDPYTGKMFRVPGLPNPPASALTASEKAPLFEYKSESSHYDPDTDTHFAEGNLVFSDKTAKISANAMRYDVKKHVIEFTGSVRVDKGMNLITGEKILYWLDTGKVETKSRTKTVIKREPPAK